MGCYTKVSSKSLLVEKAGNLGCMLILGGRQTIQCSECRICMKSEGDGWSTTIE
jgi:hypothetical protein